MSPSRIKHNEHRVIAQTSPDQTRQLNHKTTLRVVVHVGGRTRQRRSPAGTRRADRRPAWVCGLSPVTARLVCREDITVAVTSVVKKTPFEEFCELSVQTRGCARGAARPSILRSVSSCAQAVVLDKDVVRRALDGQIDRQRGWVSCLR